MSAPPRIIVNADVRVMDLGENRASAIAWNDGAIIRVGDRAQVEAAVGPGAQVFDASGASVLPGFIDAHHHPWITALYGDRVLLGPPRVKSVVELMRALCEASKTVAPGEWLLATDWDEMLLDERRPPTRRELDDAVPNHPLIALHYSYHRAVANSRALDLAGIGKHTADPSGGVICRGPGGIPDGLLLERAMCPVESLARASLVARDADRLFARLEKLHRDLVAVGITRVVDATVPADIAALYREAARRGDLIVPTVMLPVSTRGYLEAPWDALDGPASGTEEGLLGVGPVKLVFDGAPACAMCLGWWQLAGTFLSSLATAARLGTTDVLRNAMSVRPRLGRKIHTGIQIYRREEAREIVRAAVDRGFSVATHAIGNQAVKVALDAYEAAGPSLGRAGVARIEHATFLDRDLISRIRSVGAAVVAQPHFLSLPALASAPAIPGLRMTPLRWLLDAGVEVAGSSDAPVAGFSPLDAVRSAVTRAAPDQRISLDEALALYTRRAASVMGCLDRCGTLTAGKRADLVILDRPLGDESSLEQARVRATVLGGEVVFGQIP